MIGQLFRSRKKKRTERPTFRPMLEALENRLVPSVADIDAAYHALPTNLGNLESSLSASPVDPNSIQSNINAVGNNIFTLILGAPAFEYRSRLAIDNTLVVDGIRLVQNGFNALPTIPVSQFLQIERLGITSLEQGAIDSLVVGFFPQTTGDAILR